MARRSRKGFLGELLLDTSCVLPLVGIGVEGLDEDIYNRILARKLYYPSALLPELVGVMVELARKEGIELPDAAVEGFNSIVYGGRIEIVPPEGSDVKVVSELVTKGWSDIFDALLYATAKRLGVKVLSMDVKFREFLEEHGYETELFVEHGELVKELEVESESRGKKE